jgi:hypothetical protein
MMIIVKFLDALDSILVARNWWLALVVGLVLVAASVTASADLSSQPTMVHGAHFLASHGSLVPVSRAAYARSLAAHERITCSLSCAFYSLAVVLNSVPRWQLV